MRYWAAIRWGMPMFAGWTSREKALLVLNGILIVALGGMIFYQTMVESKETSPEGFQPYFWSGEEGGHVDQGEGGHEGETALSSPSNRDLAVQEVVVDVKGAVLSPGVYALSSDERVIDALEKAGGLREEAATEAINLAQKLTDGMVIYVPTREEVGENQGVSFTISPPPGQGTGKININLASVEELQKLPGIGPARAQAIVRYREEHGPFQSLEELTNVSGIGPKILENIKDQIEL